MFVPLNLCFAYGLLICAVSCAAVVIVFSPAVAWVGRTDVNVQFIVADTDSEQPIANATIYIRAESGGFCEDREPGEFTLTTDRNGVAYHISRQCVCFGSKGTFKDTFGIHLPNWWCRASASGYIDSKPVYLDVPDNKKCIQRGTPI